jgi:hypothetical protein
VKPPPAAASFTASKAHATWGGYAGQRLLIAGAGHSAANLIVSLTKLPVEQKPAAIHWISRQPTEVPCPLVPDDPLIERDRICAAANTAAASGQAEFRAGTTVSALARNDDGSLRVTLKTDASSNTIITVDRIIAATGYRPDWTAARELHIQTCWATEGTYPLAASLLSAGDAGGNCLATPVQGADTLLHPEPGFYALGMKSYGRSPGFHLAIGFQQIEALIARISDAHSKSRSS